MVMPVGVWREKLSIWWRGSLQSVCHDEEMINLMAKYVAICRNVAQYCDTADMSNRCDFV